MSLPHLGQDVNAPVVRAITTHYAGCRFRSRLEARWAVFFDELAIPWEYEVQGFVVEGTPYLPDFWLPYLNLYYEVKPEALLSDYRDRLALLAEGGKRRVVMASGNIPRPDTFYPGTADRNPGFFMETYYPDGNLDESHAWCRCDGCGVTGIEYLGYADRLLGCGCDFAEQEDPRRAGAYHPDILRAYETARSRRFEHGENGRAR
jgi:hypothetical protein